jgi:D-alanyl-D-alanine carboxypeptidase/D-alanyl-D-alanine-endopeptidase (penicillin-binding protein 4)
MRHLFALCIAAPLVSWLLLIGGVSAQAADPLGHRVDEFLKQPHLQTAHVGLLFVDLASGETVLARNPEKLFAPASVTKLFSTATALDALGADHRFRTPIHYRGTLRDGILEGDLLLVASGDLTLGGRTNEAGEIAFEDSDHTYANWMEDATLTPQDPLAGIRDLAKQIAATGLKRVRGDVLIDDRLFEPGEGSGSGPSKLTPIVVNDNVLDFTFEPTEPGQPAKVSWRPQTALFNVEIAVETVREDVPLETWFKVDDAGKLRVTGKIPANKGKLVRIFEVPEPAAFARAVLIEALREAGVEVTAEITQKHPTTPLPATDGYGNLPKLAELVSPPLAENARLILKVSHNLHASTLPLLVASSQGRQTLAEGFAVEREFFKKAELPLAGISFGGGAGGSRADYVTPAATVQLLRYMARQSDFPVYERALPILGVDGTLAKACSADSPAKGKVHAKTGTLVWGNLISGQGLCTSKALAGYLDTASGRRLAFAAFFNGVQLGEGVDTKRLGKELATICELVHAER